MTLQRQIETLPADWGKGVFTSEALDLLRIAIAFGNYPKEATAKRVILSHRGQGRINAATVCRVLDEIRAEFNEND